MSILTELKPIEISIVDKGANKRKFLILKRKGHIMSDLINKVLEMSIEDEDKLNEELVKAQLDEEAVEAIKAALKLLRAVKDKLPAGAADTVFSALAQWAGYGYPQAGIVKPVTTYTEYPKPDYGKKKQEELMEKIPAELKTELEALWKAKSDELDSLKKRTEELEATLKKEAEEKERLAFVEKAKILKTIGDNEKVGNLLYKFFKIAPEEEKELEDLLTNINNAIEKSSLFKEIGTTSNSPMSAREKIQKAAEKLANEKKISYHQAYAEILKEPEFKKLYSEMEGE